MNLFSLTFILFTLFLSNSLNKNLIITYIINNKQIEDAIVIIKLFVKALRLPEIIKLDPITKNIVNKKASAKDTTFFLFNLIPPYKYYYTHYNDKENK